MSMRPEILFPLFAEITALPGIGPGLAKHFEHLAVTRPRDLLMTLPQSGIERNLRESVIDAVLPGVVTVEILIGAHHPNSVRGRPYRITVEDAQTSFQLVFFHARSDWLQKNLPQGQKRVVSGRAEMFDRVVQMVHPDHIVTRQNAAEIPAFEPIYPLSAGLNQRQVARAANAALDLVPDLPEWIDPLLKAKQGWPDWRAALRNAHHPTKIGDLSPHTKARERLAYDEILAHQLTLALAREMSRTAKGIPSIGTGALQDKVLKTLPYTPTEAQKNAVGEISADMATSRRMNRLLQGDVGSGKTYVALMAMIIAIEAGGQAVMMAPTEILARQHLETLTALAKSANVGIEILTGRDTGRARVDKLAALATGKIQILLGTHAVFQPDVAFNDLRLAVIDEQHRFGVRQRMELGQKGLATDVLVMTATPIPRSLALANYGDMDVSILDEKPAGRQPVQTVVLPNSRVADVITRLRAAVDAGRQAYWVCPLVNESDAVDWTAAAERHRALVALFGAVHVGLVHGQMRADEKDDAMAEFAAGHTRILVATTVIEVGIDVPNASIMVIEHAEKFGLAQLHQLRGRVGRGSQASTCLLIYASDLSATAQKRLQIMRQTEDGFILAEEDLKIRGAGDVLGTQQSGLPKFRIANLEEQAGLMKIAQNDARALLGTDPELCSPRGVAARALLYFMEQDQAIRLITVG